MKKLLLLSMMLVTSMSLLAQGSTWQTATLINNGATKTGTMDANTAVVWYKINVTTEGTISFTATATGDLMFYTSSCTVYGYKNNDTYSRGNFSGNNWESATVTYQATNVGKGTYYVRLSRSKGSGTFSLKYNFTACPLSNDPEPNDDYQHSSLLQSGSTVQGRLGYCASDYITDSNDWYKITVPEEGKIELIATATENLTFYVSSCTVYGYKNNDTYSRGNFTGKGWESDTVTYQATNVGKGTYYVRINRSNGSGGYRLYYKFTPCPLTNDPEPNDDYQHSSLLQSGSTVQGRLGYCASDDITDSNDWYKITVPEEGKIELIATATENLTFYVSSCTVYGYKNNDTYSRGNFTGKGWESDTVTYQATNVGKGTYYVRINRSNGSGGYRLYYKFTPCPLANDAEPNPDYEQAGWLPSGLTKQGRLGYRTSDDITDGEDWYRFTVTKAGDVQLTATATENLTFYISSCSVYTIRNNNLYRLNNFTGTGWENDTITYQATNMDAGTYYVRISRSNGSGGYRLTYNGPTKTGDVDGDNRLTIGDVSDLINYLLSGNASGIYLADADLDGDGKVNISDVTELINALLSGN